MAAQSDWSWNFRPTGYNALAWSGSEGNAAQRFLLCSVVLKPTHTQLSPGKFLYYLWEIISESITDADEEASFRYGSDTDRMVGMSNPAVWIIHSDQPHSPSLNICSILFLSCVGCTNTIMFLSVVLRNMSGWPELWKENSYRLTASRLYTNITDWTAAQTRKHPNLLLLSGGENWNTIEKLSSLKSSLHFSASKFYF